MRDPEEDLSHEEFVRLIRAVPQGRDALELELVALGFSEVDEAAEDALRLGPRIAGAVVDGLDQRIAELAEEEDK